MEDIFGYLMKAELADYCREQASKDIANLKYTGNQYARWKAALQSCGGNHPNNTVVYKIRNAPVA